MPAPQTRYLNIILSLAVLSALTAGCSSTPASDDQPYGAPAGSVASPAAGGAAPSETPDAGAPAAQAGGPGGPMMGGGNPTAPLTPTPELDKKIADAEKGGDKKVIAAAYAERGYARMTDDNAGARVKYRAALEDFRAALKLDPNNAEATKNKQMIEDIYRSMGRPVPGEEGGEGGEGEKAIGFPMGESKKPG